MNKISEKLDVYQLVTNQIIELLERHKELNYTSTWTPANGDIFAFNPVTKTVYSGINQLLLSFSCITKGYELNRWLTFKQIQELNGSIKKGERSTLITYVNYSYFDEEGKNVTSDINKQIKLHIPIRSTIKRVPFLRYYLVFNIGQVEGLPDKFFEKENNLRFSEPEKDEIAEDVIKKSGVRINFVRFTENIATVLTGASANYYDSLKDEITLADRKQFTGKEAFYKTAFHELGHWTGHPSRLNRQLRNAKQSKEYAFEELIAELSSAFISGLCGFSSQVTNNAAYIHSWLECLHNDKKFILLAAAKAQQAADFIKELVGLRIEHEINA